jgi:hypothetical protein
MSRNPQIQNAAETEPNAPVGADTRGWRCARGHVAIIGSESDISANVSSTTRRYASRTA